MVRPFDPTKCGFRMTPILFFWLCLKIFACTTHSFLLSSSTSSITLHNNPRFCSHGSTCIMLKNPSQMITTTSQSNGVSASSQQRFKNKISNPTSIASDFSSNDRLNWKKILGSVMFAFSTFLSLPVALHASVQESSMTAIDLLDDSRFQKSLVSSPSSDFWYPPYLLGEWKTKFQFVDAKFTDKIPIESLAASDHLPGFNKYSVFLFPEMGKDATMAKRVVQVDSHPREDRSFNLRELVTAFTRGTDESTVNEFTTIDTAPYNYQSFSIVPSPWKIRYHDKTGEGLVELLPQRRDIQVYPGNVETIEFFKQKHERLDFQTNKRRTVMGDFALNWKLSVPEAVKDEYITEFDLSKSKKLVGTLNILVYLQPTTDLYFKAPGKPAGVFTYSVDMDRIPSVTMDDVNYPYVPSNDGDVELSKYFGY